MVLIAYYENSMLNEVFQRDQTVNQLCIVKDKQWVAMQWL